MTRHQHATSICTDGAFLPKDDRVFQLKCHFAVELGIIKAA